MVTAQSTLEPGWTEGDVDVDGVAIHYSRTGDGGLPPLLLAHGFTDTGRCWGRVALALQDRFDVVMIDARNHGRSGTGPGDPSLLPTDVEAVVAALGFERVGLMGHSIGARTMAAVAAAQPNLVSRLVLEDPPWWADPDTADDSSDRIEQVRAYVRSLGAMTDTALRELADEQHGDWDDAEYPAWIEGKQLLRPESAESLRRTDWRPIAAQLAAPTLLVRADPARDGIVTAEVASQACELNERITVAVVPDAGHNIRRENFAGFMAAVEGFLLG
jgi:pimeloyl-ACP methyl ester carboxylesterase